MAAIGLEPDEGIPRNGESCLIRGGAGCAAGVRVVTESALAEGHVVLTAGRGLFFSEEKDSPAGAALSGQTNTPPASVNGARDFYLGATNGGPHALSYALLDPGRTVCRATNISVEVVLARLVTNAYCVAFGSADPLEVGLDPVSYDPAGFALFIDDEWRADGQPPWQVDVSGLSAGGHTLTVTPYTFPDLAVSATINVVKVDLGLSNAGPVDLLGTNTLTVTTIPDLNMQCTRGIEIAWADDNNWKELTENTCFIWTPRIAGHLKLHARATIGGQTFYSESVPIEVRFPDVSAILSDFIIESAIQDGWSYTLAAASSNGMCEIGFHIFLNTRSGAYETGTQTIGDVFSATNALGMAAEVVLPAPPAEVVSGPDGEGATYLVARFHTHTTTEYWIAPPIPPYPEGTTYARDVGPSAVDVSGAHTIPSIVYDYNADPSAQQPKTIINGWPKDSPASLYTYGVTRRPTP